MQRPESQVGVSESSGEKVDITGKKNIRGETKELDQLVPYEDAEVMVTRLIGAVEREKPEPGI